MDSKGMRLNQIKVFAILALTLLAFVGCETEIRNIAEPSTPPHVDTVVNPIDINQKGLGLLQHMQGHWVGQNRIIADQYEWFSFDYRAISSSHTSGIFEGGSMGNLFTSFFVTDFKNTRTIMARNGGILNGIYRTSYFVLDSINESSDADFYRLVDAYGGTQTMWMELKFIEDSLYFNAYTSMLGIQYPPNRHMTFKAFNEDTALSSEAAQLLGYPKNEPAVDFSAGFNVNYLYQDPTLSSPRSATFVWQGTEDIATLGQLAGDPWIISDIPHISTLTVKAERNSNIQGVPLLINLSREPLTDDFGYLVSDLKTYDSILLFSELISNQDSLTYTYLHPGDYYVTIIADKNQDMDISVGDITHKSQKVTILPESSNEIIISQINVQN